MTAPPRPLTSAEALADAGLIDAAAVPGLARVAARYAVAVTPTVAALVNPADVADPIARQFVPDLRELDQATDETADPIGDAAHSPVKGLVHRYPDRVLLKVASICPVYCRFCFRREQVGPALGDALVAGELEAAIAYIAATPSIWEVILTGGDPLILSPRRIGEITAALGRIAHVKVLRWHSRVPVVTPERVDDDLISALKSPSQAVYVAIHANHARELTSAARAACGRLVDRGIVLVSQSVLLKGINDDAASLDALMRAFVESRIKPYYLHHLDRAPGTAHLRTSIETGQALMRQLRGRLSGLAQPTYVVDLPGGAGKMPIGPAYLTVARRNGAYVIEDFQGRSHDYCECGADGEVGG